MDRPEPWERQHGETSKQFEAFVRYRDAPLTGGRRSRHAIATELGLSLNRVMAWARSNGWADRASLWDDHQDQQWRHEVIRERHRVAQRQARIARTLQGKALAALALLKPEDITAADALRMLATAKEMELNIYGRLGDDGELITSGNVSIVVRSDLVPTEIGEPVIVDAAPFTNGSNGSNNGHLRAIQ